MSNYMVILGLSCDLTLLAGNDIRNMTPATREILLNREMIAVDQDILGKKAKRIRDDSYAEIFAKPLAFDSWEVGLFNRNDSIDQNIRISWNEIGITGRMKVRDLWEHQDLGDFSEYFEVTVKPHQCIVVRVVQE